MLILALLEGTGLLGVSKPFWTQDYPGSYWAHLKSSNEAVALGSVTAAMVFLLLKGVLSLALSV